MKRFLANENFPASIVSWLRENGHDVVFAVLLFLKRFFKSDVILEGYFTVAAPSQFRQTPLER